MVSFFYACKCFNSAEIHNQYLALFKNMNLPEMSMASSMVRTFIFSPGFQWRALCESLDKTEMSMLIYALFKNLNLSHMSMMVSLVQKPTFV